MVAVVLGSGASLPEWDGSNTTAASFTHSSRLAHTDMWFSRTCKNEEAHITLLKAAERMAMSDIGNGR